VTFNRTERDTSQDVANHTEAVYECAACFVAGESEASSDEIRLKNPVIYPIEMWTYKFTVEETSLEKELYLHAKPLKPPSKRQRND
jgi:hypothetical protein